MFRLKLMHIIAGCDVVYEIVLTQFLFKKFAADERSFFDNRKGRKVRKGKYKKESIEDL